MVKSEITADMTIKEAYAVMKEHYPETEYYISVGKDQLYLGLDHYLHKLNNIPPEMFEGV